MLGIIYGKSGTGKSEYLFREMEKAAVNDRVFLLVPDREAVMAESRAASLSSAGNIEVLTFTRLCNTLFRTYGGLCSHYIGKGAKKLVMRTVMRAVAPMLHEYSPDSGLSIYEKMTAMRTVFYQDGITPDMLSRAAGALPEADPLGKKLSDLAVLFAAFDLEVASRWEDPDGVLSRAALVLAEHAFFEKSTVFIDSFTSFSPQQTEILQYLFRDAKDVYITMPYLPEEKDEASACFLAATDEKLRRVARRAGIDAIHAVTLRDMKRYESAELAFLSAEISGQTGISAAWREEPTDITLVRAANSFAEAEAAALRILRAVRGGMMYRDMAVIVRDPASWRGILDAVFRKYEIPYFLSSRTEITEKSLIKLIFSAYAVISGGFRAEDVIAYTKTGFANITTDDVSLFENYIVKWKLRGKFFTGDDPWMMHPRGYGAPFTQEDHEILSRLAVIRETVMAPLRSFSAANKTAHTVRERATLLFDFLSALGASEKLLEKAENAEIRGDKAGASETYQLWNALMDALDQLVTSAGESEADIADFSGMLKMLLLETDIGKIPTSVDEVTIAGASETLAGEHDMILLLGANEGAFPQRVTEEGLFSENEKRTLSSLELHLSDRLEKRVSEELYYFYRAAVMPKRSLYISFSHYGLSGGEERESIGVKRIRALFPKLSLHEHELSAPLSLLENKATAFEQLGAVGGTLGRELYAYFENDPLYRERMQYLQTPIGAEKTVLSAENAALLFPETLKTSYTRLEKFIKCRFAYFCEHELHLRDDTPASFGAVDIGSFMHGVLEKTMHHIAEGGEGDLEREVREIAGQYVTDLFGRKLSELPKRLHHLFRYLTKSALIFARRMQEEFRESAFRPCDFELTVGKSGNAVIPMRLCTEDIEVELRGKIDRVDMFEGEGGKLYIRVVDYKTGEKTFDIKNVKLGLDMQMLLYLFSIWENGERRYHGEIVPAGVLYAGIKPPRVDLAVGEHGCEEDIAVKASGLFLKDEAILRAMDPALSGKWIPVKEKDLEKGKSNLVGLEAFLDLKKEVSETVLAHASELKKGKAEAHPMKEGGVNPCEYCRMRAVCRIK